MFQADGKAEENMAQKRAVLLEKRLRREKESQQRKMQLEAELEQKKEEARYVDTSPHLTKFQSTQIGTQCYVSFCFIWRIKVYLYIQRFIIKLISTVKNLLVFYVYCPLYLFSSERKHESYLFCDIYKCKWD